MYAGMFERVCLKLNSKKTYLIIIEGKIYKKISSVFANLSLSLNLWTGTKDINK